jgi:tetratricopeptide (TPR) repeat protein
VYRLAIAAAYIAVVAGPAHAQHPDYEAMVSLRSSSGFKSALEAANAQLSRNAKDATAAGVRALVFANAVDFLGMPNAQARESRQKALASAREISESNPWTRAAYGLNHMFDDPAGAERELLACIESDPGFLECYNLYGDLLRKTERLEKAKEVYRRALDRWPRDGELLVSHALLLQQGGQVEAALKVLEDLTRVRPDFARGHWHLACIEYESGGDRAIALREAKAALALDPLIWNGRKLLEMLGEGQAPNNSPERTRER